MAENNSFSKWLRAGQEAGPSWQVLAFVSVGLASVYLALVLMGHLHSYGQLLIIPIIIVVPFTIGYLVAMSRQVWAFTLEHVKALRWWHLFWFIIFFSGLVLRKRSSSDITSAPVDSAAGVRVALVTLTGCYLLMRLFTKRTNWLESYCRGIVGFLTFFACVCLTSTLWSVYWPWTLYKSCEYGVDVALLAATLVVVLKTEDYKTLFDYVMALYGVLMICVWIGAIVSPDTALSHNFEYGEQGIGLIGVQLQGVFPDIGANGVGEYSAMLGLLALCRLLPIDRSRKYNRLWYWFLFAAMMATCFLAQTRSAIGGFCIGLFFLFLLSDRVAQGATIVIVGGMAAAMTSVGTLALQYLQRGQTAGQFASLSDRVTWWAFAFKQYMNAPLTGLGAWAAGRFAVLAKLGEKGTATVHSDWVEVLIGTSIWGLIPIIIVFVIAWYVLIRYTINHSHPAYDRQLAFEAVCILGLLTARTFFITNLTLHAPVHFFAVLGVAEFFRRKVGFA